MLKSSIPFLLAFSFQLHAGERPRSELFFDEGRGEKIILKWNDLKPTAPEVWRSETREMSQYEVDYVYHSNALPRLNALFLIDRSILFIREMNGGRRDVRLLEAEDVRGLLTRHAAFNANELTPIEILFLSHARRLKAVDEFGPDQKNEFNFLRPENRLTFKRMVECEGAVRGGN